MIRIVLKSETVFLLLFLNSDTSTARVIHNAGNESVQCLMTTTDNSKTYVGKIVPYKEGYAYTNGEPPINPDNMPEAPRDFDIETNGNGTSITWFITRSLYGVKYLKHFILQVDQTYIDKESGDGQMDTKYIKVDLIPRIPQNMNVKFDCTYRIKKNTYMIEGTLWVLGDLKQTTDRQVISYVDEHSRTRTIRKRIDADYINNLQLAEACICNSTVYIETSLPSNASTSLIKITNISPDTPIEIQLINHTTNGDYVVKSWMEKGADFEKGKELHTRVSNDSAYYIRVIRHCLTGYLVSCGKQQADTMRSKALKIVHDVIKSGHGKKLRMGKVKKRKKRNKF